MADQAEPEKRPRIFLYCDDPSHPGRRVAVTNFVGLSGRDVGRWNERYTSSAAQGERESGTTLIDDRLPVPGEISGAGRRELKGRVRSGYTLTCRKCRSRAVIARENNLFSALTALARRGFREVPLTLLAATLQRQSEERRADPEPGQG